MPEKRAFKTIDEFVNYIGKEGKQFSAFQHFENRVILVNVEFDPGIRGLKIFSAISGGVVMEVSDVSNWGIQQYPNKVVLNNGGDDFFALYTTELSLKNLR
jgi:hypothetical protein